jgi:hypothetical protein
MSFECQPVDYRMQAVSAQRELSTRLWSRKVSSDDGIFVKSLLVDSYPVTMSEIGRHYLKQKIYRAYYYREGYGCTWFATSGQLLPKQEENTKYLASSWSTKAWDLLNCRGQNIYYGLYLPLRWKIICHDIMESQWQQRSHIDGEITEVPG